jgi:protein tyrosine phosphatase (PTP) superfamily phosphohydrolase (DUF442 family)
MEVSKSVRHVTCTFSTGICTQRDICSHDSTGISKGYCVCRWLWSCLGACYHLVDWHGSVRMWGMWLYRYRLQLTAGVKLFRLLFVTLQIQVTAYCRCGETVKLFRLLFVTLQIQVTAYCRCGETVKLFRLLFVTLQIQVTAYCRCGETVKLFRLLFVTLQIQFTSL